MNVAANYLSRGWRLSRHLQTGRIARRYSYRRADEGAGIELDAGPSPARCDLSRVGEVYFHDGD